MVGAASLKPPPSLKTDVWLHLKSVKTEKSWTQAKPFVRCAKFEAKYCGTITNFQKTRNHRDTQSTKHPFWKKPRWSVFCCNVLMLSNINLNVTVLASILDINNNIFIMHWVKSSWYWIELKIKPNWYLVNSETNQFGKSVLIPSPIVQLSEWHSCALQACLLYLIRHS